MLELIPRAGTCSSCKTGRESGTPEAVHWCLGPHWCRTLEKHSQPDTWYLHKMKVSLSQTLTFYLRSIFYEEASRLEDTCENTAVLQCSELGMFKDAFSTRLMGAVNDSFPYVWLHSTRVPRPLSSGKLSAQAFSSVWSFLFQMSQSSQGRTPAAWPSRSSSRLSHKK